ncbi:PilZ domain-containing protein [Methylobacterium gnaphalii]|uniref:PilZ domain-containing protein n=1 Tax=Methylobacterium gnaphalii TaxID=1010610 RepID=A0A512JFR7_9HYPH|nr:PilZ domain-containing protein [Methylobacterium gnaphalii]GEP08794.1 hypothetical protein MGN01_06390 [Methylobacterium gnaphalii]GJD69384.1 hypothetical protein MMMDOFMJ_2315 [Methylobacterium gnaphalii]GLS47560.1 hypothetical protein GCM10007885_04040 [Methylobacterium gnaphalii]
MSNGTLDWGDENPDLPAAIGIGEGNPLVDRREPRSQANLIATIRLSSGEEIRCIVRDVSKSGARLGLPRGCVLPESFMFKVSGRRFVFLVRLAWQRDCYAGVRIERIARLPANAAN